MAYAKQGHQGVSCEDTSLQQQLPNCSSKAWDSTIGCCCAVLQHVELRWLVPIGIHCLQLEAAMTAITRQLCQQAQPEAAAILLAFVDCAADWWDR